MENQFTAVWLITLVSFWALPGLWAASSPKPTMATGVVGLVPPIVQITANFLGGNAQDLEKTVAQPIEEQLIGLDGMLYFLSTSGNDGTLNIQVTFRLGTNGQSRAGAYIRAVLVRQTGFYPA